MRRNVSCTHLSKTQRRINILRENGWNDRFIYGNMGDFSGFSSNSSSGGFYPNKSSTNGFYKVNKVFESKMGGTRQNFYLTQWKKRQIKSSSMPRKLKISARSNSYIQNENYLSKNDNDNEITDKILKLWNDLCVYDKYKDSFCSIANQITDEDKLMLYNQEIEELQDLKSKLLRYSSLIELRKKLIINLRNFNDNLTLKKKNNSFTVSVGETEYDKTLKDIQSLRQASINIVTLFYKIKKNLSMHQGKYDEVSLESKYCYDYDYLNKMKDEMSFLQKGYCKIFLHISDNNYDPFLLDASRNNDPVLNKKVPLNEDTKKQIDKCNFIILQNMILSQSNGSEAIKNGRERNSRTPNERKFDSTYNSFNSSRNNLFDKEKSTKEKETEKITIKKITPRNQSVASKTNSSFKTNEFNNLFNDKNNGGVENNKDKDSIEENHTPKEEIISDKISEKTQSKKENKEGGTVNNDNESSNAIHTSDVKVEEQIKYDFNKSKEEEKNIFEEEKKEELKEEIKEEEKPKEEY
ncbi:MAG: hypothetical protein MJ252_10045, partial [archaeon]|nr:hypothetical protein [archaeon]